jgi:(R,R)-butanediol dehydrogenase/meso-butanediol dehydrogenase/diacetyl reductase
VSKAGAGLDRMTALVYAQQGRLEIQQRPVPEPGPGEALVRVRAAGICGTDLSILAGKHPRARPPLVMGHEFAGEVAQLGEAAAGFAVGDHVTAEPLISCGHCQACRSGYPHVCQNLKLYGIDADGAFAQYVRLPVQKLRRLPASIDLTVGALVEPLSVAVHALRLSAVRLGDTVCVLGGGPIGVLVALVARLHGPRQVLLCELQPFRVRLARSLGLEVIDTAATDAVQAVLERTEGTGADVVFEVAGVSETVVAAHRMCRVRGQVVQVSNPKDLVPTDLLPLSFKELTVVGVRVYAEGDFGRAIEIAGTAGLPLARLQSEPYALEQGEEAFRRARAATDVMRVLFSIE